MIYFIQVGTDGPIKIGAAINPEERVASLQTGCPDELKLIFTSQKYTEKELQDKFSFDRIRGEWFKPYNILKFIENLKIPQLPEHRNKKCPICSFDFMHIIKLNHFSNINIEITYHCENGHLYIERQEFYKGQIYITYELRDLSELGQYDE